MMMFKNRRVSTWFVLIALTILVIIGFVTFSREGRVASFVYLALLSILTLLSAKMIREDEAWNWMGHTSNISKYYEDLSRQELLDEAKLKRPDLFRAWSEIEKRARELEAPEPASATKT